MYNKRTMVVEESMHVTFDESNFSSTKKVVANDDVDEELHQEELSNVKQDNSPCKIKRSNKKNNKQILSKIKVIHKHSPRCGGMFLFTLKI